MKFFTPTHRTEMGFYYGEKKKRRQRASFCTVSFGGSLCYTNNLHIKAIQDTLESGTEGIGQSLCSKFLVISAFFISCSSIANQRKKIRKLQKC